MATAPRRDRRGPLLRVRRSTPRSVRRLRRRSAPLSLPTPRVPVARLAERSHERRRDVLHHTRLEFAGVIAEVGEAAATIDDLPPVERAEEDPCPRLQLPDARLEVIPPVTNEDHELPHPLPLERAHEVAEEGQLCRGIHVEREGNVELRGVHAEWHEGQHRDACSALPRAPRRLGGDRVTLGGVGSVGEVQVVRLGGAPGEHGSLIARRTSGRERLLGEEPRAGGRHPPIYAGPPARQDAKRPSSRGRRGVVGIAGAGLEPATPAL